MCNIGFMENTVNHIEKRFQYYFKNKKAYPSALEKEDYRNFIFQMERIHRYGEMEDEKKYKELLKRAQLSNIECVAALRKGQQNAQ